MDKYEYNLKLEEIDKLVDQEDYREAANLADTVDWKRVRNIRTLCLISEIYEAADRLEDSKQMLVRAYRKAPVGRTVLYRLTEVTTALKQYDEALEYYTEYVQAAPHDNNRYILKYKIYRGRGSSTEELIGILKEYLEQEYTERWAYELATLYRQIGQTQNCLAVCDDLVLWFHTGKYVKKALELKRHYASLTPRQQQIYEECLQEEAQQEYFGEPEANDSRSSDGSVISGPDGEVIAETIMSETEKEIADEITARKAELDRAELDAKGEAAEPQAPAKPSQEEKPQHTRVLPRLHFGRKEKKNAGEGGKRQTQEARTKEEPSDIAEPQKAQEDLNKAGDGAPQPDEALRAESLSWGSGDGTPDGQDPKKLQEELAKSVRQIVSGVARKPELNEDDVPAIVEERLRHVQKLSAPEVKEPEAGKLSIDDILLSMGEKGRRIAEEARAAKAAAAAEALKADTAEPEADEIPEPEAAEAGEEKAQEPEASEEAPAEPVGTSVAEAAAAALTDEQLEALKYTSNPGSFLKKSRSLPTYSQEGLGKTRRIVNTKEELIEAARRELLATETIRIPTEEIAKSRARNEAELSAQTAAERGEEKQEEPERPLTESGSLEPAEDALQQFADTATDVYDDRDDSAYAEEDAYDEGEEADGVYAEEYEDGVAPDDGAYAEEDAYDEDEEERLFIPDHLRGLFGGFTEVDGLEEQIANAILQAESRGSDRTSRTGNILIFGAHGSGKTTLAAGIAKAVAQDKGSEVLKLARIYAADLNRKDIAATIAKISGGTLIIEEAGDLQDEIVDQLTTAMEFRTDGLLVILEDEQNYVHELLMKHPRFTMKFTAQIYLPVYTAEELGMFGQRYARSRDYRISEEGLEAIRLRVSEAAGEGRELSVGDVIAMIDQAIRRSNRFFRKLALGKKRYDENDFILLFAKDFK